MVSAGMSGSSAAIAISIESLSKRYLVGHRSRERYIALRDVIAREARNFARKARDAFRGHQIVQGDEVEEFWALRDVANRSSSFCGFGRRPPFREFASALASMLRTAP
jgi:hypothetical protein